MNRIQGILGSIVVLIFIKVNVGEVAFTVGPSMLPTINIAGDILLISKFMYKLRIGDIIYATSPTDNHKYICKRILGMENDQIYSNGELITIPQGHVYLAGDNISNSTDSRNYGPVSLGLIKGKILMRLYPRMHIFKNPFDALDSTVQLDEIASGKDLKLSPILLKAIRDIKIGIQELQTNVSQNNQESDLKTENTLVNAPPIPPIPPILMQSISSHAKSRKTRESDVENTCSMTQVLQELTNKPSNTNYNLLVSPRQKYLKNQKPPIAPTKEQKQAKENIQGNGIMTRNQLKTLKTIEERDKMMGKFKVKVQSPLKNELKKPNANASKLMQELKMGVMLKDTKIPMSPGGSFVYQKKTREMRVMNKQELEEHSEQVSEQEEQEEEEEEDGLLDSEEEQVTYSNRKPKRRRKLNPFIEEEAAVDDDEDDDFDEDDEPEVDQEELEQLEKSYLDKGRHRKLDMKIQQDDDIDAEQLAEQLKQRYSKADYGVFRGDKNVVPQNVLIPSINDPKLCMVKCKTGKERDIVMSLMKRCLNLADVKPLKIQSAFCRNGIPGDNQEDIQNALKDIHFVYANSLKFVPVNEMVSCLTIKSKEKELFINSWTRIKRGKYSGDLGQIVNLDSAEIVTVKLVPRLDPPGAESIGKRKKNENRAVPKLFSFKDYVGKRDYEARDGGYYYAGDFYTKEGYLEKAMKVLSLQTENVNPSLEEVTNFSGGIVGEGIEDVALLGAVSSATIEDFQKGEIVQVISGELADVKGVVQFVQGGVVTILPDASLGWTEALEFPAKELRKCFSIGGHVKIATGVYKDVTGLIINIEDNVASILSDADLKPISVFTKDLRAATEISIGEVISSPFSEDDLVQLSLDEMGVILKVENESLTVLNQYGSIVKVKPQQVRSRNDMKRAVSNDKNGQLFSSGDQVTIVDGPPNVLKKRGTVMFASRKFVFLKCPELKDNKGIFATTSQCVAIPVKLQTPDVFNNNNIYMASGNNRGGHGGNRGGRGGMRGGMRDNVLSKHVTITGGPYKGYKGIVTHVTDSMARVELQATSRTVNVERSKIRTTEQDIRRPSQDTWNTSNVDRAAGGMTPAAWDTRTPMHGGAKTPMHRMDDSRTPAWNAGSKTPGGEISSGWGTTPYSEANRTDLSYSNQYQNALADTPNNPKTPSQWGDSNQISHQHTPAAYPNMPSVQAGVPSTPANISSDAEVPNSDYEWVTIDIEVKIVQNGSERFNDGLHDGVHGTIREMQNSTMLVKLQNGDTERIPVMFLEPVRPEKKNSVKVILGEYKNQIGNLISVDGIDGVVKLQHGSEFKVMPMNLLAKHVPA